MEFQQRQADKGYTLVQVLHIGYEGCSGGVERVEEIDTERMHIGLSYQLS